MICRYVIGVDVGERSVGLAAIALNDEGIPCKILAIASFIHDGGVAIGGDKYVTALRGDSGLKPGDSRLKEAGLARRTRHLYRHRKQRLAVLDRILDAAGITRLSVVDAEDHCSLGITPGVTHEAWLARDVLSRAFVEDPLERNHLLRVAIAHMARHRGWRNPWWRFHRLEQESFEATEGHALMMQKANEICPERSNASNVDVPVTLGQATALVLRSDPSALIRPRGQVFDVKKGRYPQGWRGSSLIFERVRQSDELRELRTVLERQGVAPSLAVKIMMQVFKQLKPSVPKERIGSDALTGEPRAPRASLEFQEFRIRQWVGNLRVGREREALTPEMSAEIVNLLRTWNEDERGERPLLRDVAEYVGLDPRSLNYERRDVEALQPPIDQVVHGMPKHLKESNLLTSWWGAAGDQVRADFVNYAVDPWDTNLTQRLMDDSDGPFWDGDKAAEAVLDGLRLPAGRSKYSRQTLITLNQVMRDHNCDEYTAGRIAFGDRWRRPPLDTLDTPIEHPVVQRVNNVTRKFLANAVRQWGQPERVVVEHVREAFMGPGEREKYRKGQQEREKRRSRAAEGLKALMIPEPTGTDIRRYLCVERQNCQCLYCSRTITFATSELDHIVPVAAGGSNREANVVAVCQQCNRTKADKSFSGFAQQENLDVEGMVAGVRAWHTGLGSAASRKLIKQVEKRLRGGDESLDEAPSMESTAYAARAIRERIAGSLGLDLEQMSTHVLVFNGAITSEARWVGGIDRTLLLRGQSRKTRFDRRHHAVDAAVVATLTPAVGQALALRRVFRMGWSIDNPSRRWQPPDWHKFLYVRDPKLDPAYRKWCNSASELAKLLSAAIADDRIPVVRPLRLGENVGPLHMDGIYRLDEKRLDDAWSGEEISRIVDDETYLEMFDLARTKRGELPSDPDRELPLHGTEHSLQLFPKEVTKVKIGAAMLVRGGAVKVGETVHHARIYACQEGSGLKFRLIRVYAAEFRRMGLAGRDLFTADLPATSVAMRRADPLLVELLATDKAKQIGWITRNDELEIPETFFTTRYGELAGERRWYVSGYQSRGKIEIAPAYLSKEEVPEELAELMSKRWDASLDQLFKTQGLTVLRRTSLGYPRWHNNAGNQPVSWVPLEEARRVFDA